MGHMKAVSVEKIFLDLNKLYRECTDSRNDGWTAFGYKQDMLSIKYYLDQLLNKCPTFIGEQDFINGIEKEITWGILKK